MRESTLRKPLHQGTLRKDVLRDQTMDTRKPFGAAPTEKKPK